MAKYRKKPVVIEAHKWEKNGDHPLDHADFGNAVDSEIARDKYHEYLKTEGKLVRRYRNPIGDGNEFCQYCGNVMHIHGWIDTKEGGHIVCPGDMIITGVLGEHYPCKPDIFEQTYELVIGRQQRPQKSVANEALIWLDHQLENRQRMIDQLRERSRKEDISNSLIINQIDGIKQELITIRFIRKSVGERT